METEEFANCVPDREKVRDYLSHSEKAQRMADGLREIVEMAGSRNIADTPITVVIEDFDDRNSPIACVSGMQWFAEQVPGLCFTFDTGNFIIHGENIFAAWEELKDKVVHVHCKDRKISSDKPLQTQKNATPDIKECYLPAAVGEGCIPIKELVYKMKEYGYRGYLAIEHFDAADQEAYMQKSAANLQEYCS